MCSPYAHDTQIARRLLLRYLDGLLTRFPTFDRCAIGMEEPSVGGSLVSNPMIHVLPPHVRDVGRLLSHGQVNGEGLDIARASRAPAPS